MSFTSPLSLSPRQRRAWAECLGRVVADVRQRRGLSAIEAARRAGLKATEWEAMENGKPTLVSLEQFQAIARILGIDWGVVRMLAGVLCIPFRAPRPPPMAGERYL